MLPRMNDSIGYSVSCVAGRFTTNRTQCVRPMSTLAIVCPNTATLLTIRPDPLHKNELYENFWLVSRQSYERCEVNTSDPKEQRLLACDQPLALKYYSVVFQKYSADARLEFDPGMDYYFIGEKYLVYTGSSFFECPEL